MLFYMCLGEIYFMLKFLGFFIMVAQNFTDIIVLYIKHDINLPNDDASRAKIVRRLFRPLKILEHRCSIFFRRKNINKVLGD